MYFVYLLRTVLDEGENNLIGNRHNSTSLLSRFSESSETVRFSTIGTIPSEPDPPILLEKGVKHITLSWTSRPTDETFTLQMNDESNYFRNKYTGPSLSYTVTDLYRNTEYKFRVSYACFNSSFFV